MVPWYDRRTFGSLPAASAKRLPDQAGLVFEDHRFSFSEIAPAVRPCHQGFDGARGAAW